MTDQSGSSSGLSFFEDSQDPRQAQAGDVTQATPAVPSGRPQFAMVRRGYEKEAVDAFLELRDAEHARALADAQEAAKQVQSLRTQLEEAQAKLGSDAATPTFSALGEHAAAMLRLAEEQAAEVLSSAQRTAETTHANLIAEAAALKADAEKEAADIRTVQLQEIEERRTTVLGEAEQERTLAKAEADDILAAAQREADQLRMAAETEASGRLTSAEREAEQVRAGADREATEARRILALEKER